MRLPVNDNNETQEDDSIFVRRVRTEAEVRMVTNRLTFRTSGRGEFMVRDDAARG